jgi:hypothetical protein
MCNIVEKQDQELLGLLGECGEVCIQMYRVSIKSFPDCLVMNVCNQGKTLCSPRTTSTQRHLTQMASPRLTLQWIFKKELFIYITFICPCITSISLKYNQQDAKFSRSIYFYKLLYMFQAVPLPIIRSTKLYIQHQVLSNQYCCLLLSWMRWNSMIAAGSSTGLTLPDAVCTVLYS